MTTLEEKEAKLNRDLTKMGKVLVAFSAGVDSTYLLKAAHNQLGEGVLAVTATSQTYPEREKREAQALIKEIGVNSLFIESREMESEDFRQNPDNRCYYCKGELFGKLRKVADEHNIPFVLDGANTDDDNDHRPGAQAAREWGVVSPLREAGLGKEEIRQLSKKEGLTTWNKPSFACLASRFPYGNAITAEKLSAVEKGEELLRQLGFTQVRLRHHDNLARIEVPARELSLLLDREVTEKLSRSLKELGFLYVTVDIDGYRTGSMNEVLK